MGLGSLEFGQAKGNIPDAIPMVNDTTTMLAGVVLVVVILVVVGFLLFANHQATGSVWGIGSERIKRRRKGRRK